MHVTGEPDGPPAEGRRRGRRPGLRAAGGQRHPGGAGRARAHRPRAPRRGLADGLRADLAAQPGLGVGGRRRRRARGAATATRASSPTRPSRRPTGRSRSPSATTASSRGCARRSASASWPPTSASRPTPRASSTPTSSARRLGEAIAREPADALGRACCARPPCPPGRSTASTRRSRSPRSSAWSRPRSDAGVPLVRPPLRVDGERPPIRRGPPALDEHGDEIRAWLRGERGCRKRLEPPSGAALGLLSAGAPQNLSGLHRAGALPLIAPRRPRRGPCSAGA